MGLLSKVHRYRWELWLLVGITVLSWAAQQLFNWSAPSLPFIYSLHYSVWYNLAGEAVSLVLLVGSYWWVRRLERPVLQATWQLAITLGVLALANLGAIQVAVTTAESGLVGWWYGWLFYLQLLAWMLVFGYFAWRVSGQGIGKSLVVAAIGLNVLLLSPRAHAQIPVVFAASTAFASAAVTLVSVYALRRSDSDAALRGWSLAALSISPAVAYGSLLTAWLSAEIDPPEWTWTYLLSEYLEIYLVYEFLPLMLMYGLALGLAYVCRPRPPKPVEPPVKFEGLYR